MHVPKLVLPQAQHTTLPFVWGALKASDGRSAFKLAAYLSLVGLTHISSLLYNTYVSSTPTGCGHGGGGDGSGGIGDGGEDGGGDGGGGEGVLV